VQAIVLLGTGTYLGTYNQLQRIDVFMELTQKNPN
jgi:hypothetical protein